MKQALFHCMMWCVYALPYATRAQYPGHHIYFACRASIQKTSLIATGFNLSDTLISHVGIGVMKNNVMKIFHVEDKKGNALSIDSPEHFTQRGIVYYCVYALPVSERELQFLDSILHSHPATKFDYDLSLENDALYCSEFCLKVLKTINPAKFDFKPLTRELKLPLIRSYLGRDSITYVPVDFFLAYPEVKKVTEITFRSL